MQVHGLTTSEGKSLHLVGIGIAEVLTSKRLNSPAWLSTWLFLTLNRHRVVPLYTRVDARWPTESRPAHNRVRLGDFLYMSFCTSISLHMAVYLQYRASSRPQAFGPSIRLNKLQTWMFTELLA